MILSLDVLDYELLHRRFSRYPVRDYGLVMAWGPEAGFAGILAQGESLFITAHGAGDTIGHPDGAPRFSALELACYLEDSVLPCNYGGDIYIAAPGAGHSYVDDLAAALATVPARHVFGMTHRCYGQLRPARHSDWQAAQQSPSAASPATAVQHRKFA